MPTSPGSINGDISKRGGHFKHPLIVISVDSIDEHKETISSAGGTVLMDKVEVPNMGYYALIQDSEGNTIGIWENI